MNECEIILYRGFGELCNLAKHYGFEATDTVAADETTPEQKSTIIFRSREPVQLPWLPGGELTETIGIFPTGTYSPHKCWGMAAYKMKQSASKASSQETETISRGP